MRLAERAKLDDSMLRLGKASPGINNEELSRKHVERVCATVLHSFAENSARNLAAGLQQYSW